MIYLHKVGTSTTAEILEGMAIGNTTLKNYTPDLCTEGLITKSKIGSRHTVRYTITDAGIAIAEKIIDGRVFVPQKATPPQINKMIGKYVPTMGYQRNNGNRHVQSRGYI